MSLAFVKSLGRSIGLLTLVAAVAVGYWGIQPVRIESTTSTTTPVSAYVVPEPPEIPQYADLAPLIDQRLRGPLYDPPPEPPPVIPPPPPIKVNLKLVGTVLEPGRNQALLADSKGTIHFCRVGETIDSHPGKILLESVSETDATLHVISPRETRVTLQIEGNGSN